MDRLAFDTGWEFSDEQVSYPGSPRNWRPVNLPHDASVEKPLAHENPSGAGGGYAWTGVVRYRKRFQVPGEWRTRAVVLEFEGVYMNAEVFVNGELAAFHPNGYTSFLVDIKPFLTYGTGNEVSVVANNSAQPNSRWYTGTGIYRHVWLRVGGGVHIPPWGVSVTPVEVALPTSHVMVSTEITNGTSTAASVVLRTTALDSGGECVQSAEASVEVAPDSTVTAGQMLMIPGARLWSPDEPHLYVLVSEVLVDDQVVDVERTTFGLRSVSLDRENGLCLNGAPLKLRGGCVHHDHGLLGAASYDRAEERKVELLKSAGFNALRTAHNPPAPSLLDACDRLGMLVIDEMFDCWRMGKNPNDYHLFFEQWWERDLRDTIRRDQNHPSVIMWSIGNEVPERSGVSDGYAWCQRLADCVRSLDNSRPITAAVHTLFEESLEAAAEHPPEDFFESHNCPPADAREDRWGQVTEPFFAALDVAGYNYFNGRYEFDRKQYPGRIICGTESFPSRAFASWSDTLRCANVIGDFVWTAFSYRGEAGLGRVHVDAPAGLFFFEDPWPCHVADCGDFDICGFKRPQSYFRDILWGLRREPFIAVLHPRYHGHKLSFTPWGWEPVIDDWTFPGWEGKPTRVVVYSADDEVELLVNGVSVGRRAAGLANQYKAEFEVAYEPGVIMAVGLSGGRETGRAEIRTAARPVTLRLTPDRAVLRAVYGDLACVTIEAVDQSGLRVREAEAMITVTVHGAGDLAALGTPDPASLESPVAGSCRLYQGRALGVVRSLGDPGEIWVEASSENLGSSTLCLKTGEAGA